MNKFLKQIENASFNFFEKMKRKKKNQVSVKKFKIFIRLKDKAQSGSWWFSLGVVTLCDKGVGYSKREAC